MNLENIIEDWMGFVLIFLRKPISWLSLLAPPVLHILGAGFLQVLLTSAALFLSSFFLIIIPVPKQNPLSISINESPHKDNVFESSIQEDKDPQEQEAVSCLDDSESSINTEDSEYVETITDISDDGSISDEESLIELSLPSGHYVGGHYGNNKEQGVKEQHSINYKINQMCLHKNIIQDFGLFELLAEFNDMIEEDNLIEIDISIGSIKCSRFEIEA